MVGVACLWPCLAKELIMAYDLAADVRLDPYDAGQWPTPENPSSIEQRHQVKGNLA
jgi:hypothetical protein